MSQEWTKSLADADAAQIHQALERAHIPALMASLVHLTASKEHFSAVQPHYALFAENEDGLTEDCRIQARAIAEEAILAYRQRGCPELAAMDENDVLATMHYIAGEPMDPRHISFLREELNLYGEDARRVPIDTSRLDKNYRVLIIGFGMSGILAAIRLQQEGIPFLIVEKNPQPGGTWYENTYPGCRVDSANHVYNYLFEPNTQWPNHFSGRAELYDYFDRIVIKYGLRDHVRLGTRVASCRFDEVTEAWTATLDSHGVMEELQFSAVISAVGQLNVPKMPDIEGMETFDGVAFHSARWEHEHDLSRKRVAVIGTGCSATQFIPEIAPGCGNMEVFQRTPNWLLPTPEYHQAMSDEEQWLLREIPYYARWFRFFLFRTRGADGYLPLLYAEENWDAGAGGIGRANNEMREALTMGLSELVGDDPELFEKLIPDYPPGGKRPVVDNGSYIDALKRNNVQLQTVGIARIEPGGIRTTDGQLHEADVIIYGTGFQADQFLTTTRVYGRDGTELVSSWGGDPHAYKGVVVPGFPNFYCLYGPNTNIVVGSSIIFMVECQMRYVSGCLKLQIETGLRTLECRTEVMEAYSTQIDALNSQRAWGYQGFNSWYKNEQGRVTQNWPGTHWEFWQQTREPDLADFHVT